MSIEVVVSVVALLIALALAVSRVSKKNSGPELSPTDFRKFELTEKTKVNHNSNLYRFALSHNKALLGLPVGQHISISAVINGKEIVRSYTPVTNDNTPGSFDLLVKTYQSGNISKYLDEIAIGDKINVRGPKGFFTYSKGLVNHLNMVAGGTGITPMFQIMEAIAADPLDKTSVTLLYANVSQEDILLKKELDEFAKNNSNFKIHYVLDKPPPTWSGPQGFITTDMMRKTLEPFDESSKLLVCGPLPMVSNVKKSAVELGWPKANAVSKLPDKVFVF